MAENSAENYFATLNVEYFLTFWHIGSTTLLGSSH